MRPFSNRGVSARVEANARPYRLCPRGAGIDTQKYGKHNQRSARDIPLSNTDDMVARLVDGWLHRGESVADVIKC